MRGLLGRLEQGAGGGNGNMGSVPHFPHFPLADIVNCKGCPQIYCNEAYRPLKQPQAVQQDTEILVEGIGTGEE